MSHDVMVVNKQFLEQVICSVDPCCMLHTCVAARPRAQDSGSLLSPVHPISSLHTRSVALSRKSEGMRSNDGCYAPQEPRAVPLLGFAVPRAKPASRAQTRTQAKSSERPPMMTTNCGTPMFAAPEQMRLPTEMGCRHQNPLVLNHLALCKRVRVCRDDAFVVSDISWCRLCMNRPQGGVWRQGGRLVIRFAPLDHCQSGAAIFTPSARHVYSHREGRGPTAPVRRHAPRSWHSGWMADARGQMLAAGPCRASHDVYGVASTRSNEARTRGRGGKPFVHFTAKGPWIRGWGGGTGVTGRSADADGAPATTSHRDTLVCAPL